MKYPLTLILLFVSLPLVAQDFTVSSYLGAKIYQNQITEFLNYKDTPIDFRYTEFSFNTELMYRSNEYLSYGAYYKLDIGNREFITRTVKESQEIVQTLDDVFIDNWVGPIIRVHYKGLFASYGFNFLLGDGRTPLSIENGDEDFGYHTVKSPTQITQLGARLELTKQIEFNVLFESRYRFFDLIYESGKYSASVIATRNITLMAGISYNFDM